MAENFVEGGFDEGVDLDRYGGNARVDGFVDAGVFYVRFRLVLQFTSKA